MSWYGIALGIFIVLLLLAWWIISMRSRKQRGHWVVPTQHECAKPRMWFHEVGERWECAECSQVYEITMISDGSAVGGYRKGWKWIPSPQLEHLRGHLMGPTD